MLFYRCYLSKNRPDHFGNLGCNPAVTLVLCHAWIQCLLYVSYRVYTLYEMCPHAMVSTALPVCWQLHGLQCNGHIAGKTRTCGADN